MRTAAAIAGSRDAPVAIMVYSALSQPSARQGTVLRNKSGRRQKTPATRSGRLDQRPRQDGSAIDAIGQAAESAADVARQPRGDERRADVSRRVPQQQAGLHRQHDAL